MTGHVSIYANGPCADRVRNARVDAKMLERALPSAHQLQKLRLGTHLRTRLRQGVQRTLQRERYNRLYNGTVVFCRAFVPTANETISASDTDALKPARPCLAGGASVGTLRSLPHS